MPVLPPPPRAVSYFEFIAELERRMGVPISTAEKTATTGPVVGLQDDPFGLMITTELTLPALIEAEAWLSLRLLNLGEATVH